MRTRIDGEYEIDDDFGRLDFRTLEGWLTASYWSPGIRIPEIVKGARNSALNLGCFWKGHTWLLATRDAQAVYARNGFGPLPVPENWMIIRKEKLRPPATEEA